MRQLGNAPRRIAAPWDQGHYTLTQPATIHPRPTGMHFATDLQAQNIGHASGRRGKALALHDIRSVHAGCQHFKQYFTRSRHWDRALRQVQDIRPTRFTGYYGKHG